MAEPTSFVEYLYQNARSAKNKFAHLSPRTKRWLAWGFFTVFSIRLAGEGGFWPYVTAINAGVLVFVLVTNYAFTKVVTRQSESEKQTDAGAKSQTGKGRIT